MNQNLNKINLTKESTEFVPNRWLKTFWILMICPYCKKDSKLTWKSYLKANITYRYKCPLCSKVFKIKYHLFHLFELLVVDLFLAIPILLLTFYNGYSTVEIIIFSLLLPTPIILIMDKAHDEKVEKIKIESEPANGEWFEKTFGFFKPLILIVLENNY